MKILRVRVTVETLVGSNLLGYTLVRTLYRTELGTVYLAHGAAGCPPVAIYVLDPAHSQVVGVHDAFQRELETTSSLQHKNLLKVFQSQKVGDFSCAVMEHVEGEFLDQRLSREEKIPLDESVQIMLQLLDAVEHCHAKGIAHGELSSARIFLCNDGTAKVLFLRQTRFVAAGQPLPIIPVRGPQADLCAEPTQREREFEVRRDIYSLGCVFYQMLTGHLPAEATTAIDFDSDEHTSEQSLSIASQSINRLVSSVPMEISHAIFRSLEKRRDKAFSSCSQFAGVLKPYSSSVAEQVMKANGRRFRDTSKERVSHHVYWSTWGALFVGVLAADVIVGLVFNPFQLFLLGAIFLFMLKLSVQRLRDAGFTGWLLLIPPVAVFRMLYDGSTGINQCGPDPSGRASGSELQNRIKIPRTTVLFGLLLVAFQLFQTVRSGTASQLAATRQETHFSAKSEVQDEREANRSGISEKEIQHCLSGKWTISCSRKAVDAARSSAEKDQVIARKILKRGCDLNHLRSCSILASMYRKGLGGQPDKVMARELLQKVCARGFSSDCSVLASMLSYGEGGPKNLPEAKRLYSRACDGGNFLACAGLGILLVEGQGGRKDLERARRLFTRACEAGVGYGCSNLGVVIDNEDKARASQAEVLRLHTKACDLGDAHGCKLLGLKTFWGEGVKVDYAKARTLFQKSCQGEDAEACWLLSDMLENGEGGPTDLKEAFRLSSLACDRGFGQSCNKSAKLALQTEGVEGGAETARKYASKGCQLGAAQSCLNLGIMHHQGKGGKVDYVEAAKLFKQACDASDRMATSVGCYALGRMIMDGINGPVDKEEACRLFSKSCDAGNSGACHNLGVLHLSAADGPKEQSAASRFFLKACKGGFAESCTQVGLIFMKGDGVPPNLEQARLFFSKGCEAKSAMSCFELGGMFANGWGGPIDKSEARKFHEVACSGEHAEACFALGLMLQKGDGGEKDEAEARKTLLSACRLGSLDGCAELGVMTINGVGGPASVQEGVDKLKEACDQSGALACAKLADFWSTTGLDAKDEKLAEKYRDKACELGHKPSCALKMR